jgi:hypothetical protein
MTNTAPIGITTKTATPGAVGVIGPEAILRAAFKSGTPIALDARKYAGETVHLGHVRQVMGDDGVTVETIGFDRDHVEHPEHGRIVVYLVDTARLDNAPRLAEDWQRQKSATATRTARMEERLEAEERELGREAD